MEKIMIPIGWEAVATDVASAAANTAETEATESVTNTQDRERFMYANAMLQATEHIAKQKEALEVLKTLLSSSQQEEYVEICTARGIQPF